MHRKPFSVPFFVCLLLCSSGCDHGSGEPGHAGHESDSPADHESGGHAGQESGGHDDHGADHESHGSELELALDDGEKWQVDEHTRASSARLAALVGDAQTPASAEDARALGAALDAELDLLVQGCTMTGPAHDQLHVFLTAFIPQVTALKEVAEAGDAQPIREEIGSLLEAYEAHFE